MKQRRMKTLCNLYLAFCLKKQADYLKNIDKANLNWILIRFSCFCNQIINFLFLIQSNKQLVEQRSGKRFKNNFFDKFEMEKSSNQMLFGIKKSFALFNLKLL